MRKLLLMGVCASLLLGGCDTTSRGGIGTAPPPPVTTTSDVDARIAAALAQAPAPLTRTTADERVMMVILRAYDAALTWTDNQHFAKGSPDALRVRAALIRVRNAINALEAARTAASTTDWNAAMAEVSGTLGSLRAALK